MSEDDVVSYSKYLFDPHRRDKCPSFFYETEQMSFKVSGECTFISEKNLLESRPRAMWKEGFMQDLIENYLNNLQEDRDLKLNCSIAYADFQGFFTGTKIMQNYLGEKDKVPGQSGETETR